MTATSVRPVLGHCSSFTELLMYFEVSIFTRKLAGTLSFGACDAHRGQAQRRMHVSHDKITEHSARARAGRGGACAGKSGPDSACFLRPGATGALCGTAHAPRVHVALNEDNQCERNAIARKTLRRRPVRGRGGTRPRKRRVLPRRLREPSHAHLPGRTPSLAGERVAQGAYKCDHHAVQGPRRQHSARRRRGARTLHLGEGPVLRGGALRGAAARSAGHCDARQRHGQRRTAARERCGGAHGHSAIGRATRTTVWAYDHRPSTIHSST